MVESMLGLHLRSVTMYMLKHLQAWSLLILSIALHFSGIIHTRHADTQQGSMCLLYTQELWKANGT